MSPFLEASMPLTDPSGTDVFRPVATTEQGRPSPDLQWPQYLMGQESRPVRVALVSPDEHLRHTVVQELLADARTDLVGHAPGARDGRRLINSREIDVLLIDLHLSDGTGFQLTEYVKQTRPLLEVLVISSADDEEHVLRAFRCGAHGFLLKNSWFGNYVEAVLQVANGGAAVTPGSFGAWCGACALRAAGRRCPWKVSATRSAKPCRSAKRSCCAC
jgi:CheY-like chemotaxis protein